jgi:hypothetical protein
MSIAARTLIAFAALALSLGSVPTDAQSRHRDQSDGHSWHGPAPSQGSGRADGQGRHGDHSGGHSWHGHRHCCPGPFWGSVGIGIGLGGYYDGGPWYPGDVLVESPPGVYYETLPIEPAPTPAPDPIIYPRNGQSPAQTEADRQDCNRWAATQPSARARASVFHRATLACMEGRGYTVR